MKKLLINSVIASSSFIFLTGCIGGKTYTHPNYTPQKWAIDKAQCNAFARGSYGYNQPYQVQNNNKQYSINGSSFSNNGVSTNYYGTVKQQPTMNQSMNNIAQSMMNIRYQNNINEAFEACLFQKGWRLESNVYKDTYHPSTGLNKDGYNRDGFDTNGFNKDGYNNDGFDKRGFNKYTGTVYDLDGYDFNGNPKDAMKKSSRFKDGYDKDGYDENGYDKEGYDWDGYDINGYNKDGIHMNELLKKD